MLTVEHTSSGGNDVSQLGRVVALVLSVFWGAMFPGLVAAQTGSTGIANSTQGNGFAPGAQSPLQFAGEGAALNQVSLSIGVSSLFDNNVLDNNADRISDEALALTSHFDATRQSEHLTISFDYVPFFTVYRQLQAYDRLNQSANLRIGYLLTPRVRLDAFDSFSYQNGIYPGLTGETILSGSPSPVALNSLIYAPTLRTLLNSPGLSLTFEKSRRTSLTLSGGYSQRKFGSAGVVGQPLYNSTGFDGSFQFQYKATEHTTLGFSLLHEDSTYQGGQIFGALERSQVESVFFSAGSRLTPSVTVSVYGGPQYIHFLGSSSGLVNSLEGSGGGSITKEVRKTALNLSLQRMVTDGGGFYTSVMSTNATLGVRRRLGGKWEVDLHAGGSQIDTALLLTNEKTDAMIGGIDLTHPLRGGSSLHFAYDSIHELSEGSLPVLANFDRNEVTIGFDFTLKTIPLGQ